VRAELARQREIVAAFLRDCEGRPESQEAGIAHRLNGETHWFSQVPKNREINPVLSKAFPRRDGAEPGGGS
jgi:hypothetical protein